MQPILILVLATAAGVPLSLWLRRNLATLSYRNADEADLPDPGPRWWVVWASVLVIGGLATAAVMIDDPIAYLPLLPLAITGPWLAAVDFDVLRIPNHVLASIAATTLLAVAAIAASARDWRTLVLPVVASLLAGGIFAAVHVATRGGVGFGDVKLAAVIGLAVGLIGIGTVWLSFLAGSLAGLVWAAARRNQGPIPFGPWLLSGAWIASLVMAVLTK